MKKKKGREPRPTFKTDGATEHDANALHLDLGAQLIKGGATWRWSRGRVYTFYRLGDVLMVHIGGRRSSRRNGYQHNPVVELLAQRLSSRRVCRLRGCGTTFTRNGKQRYCSPAHAATARSRRHRERM